ncbi:MAG: bifunctional DNA-formamidopyrimidine glycosylase/DNA-(apurinic or apyrimidinic site) lyase [Patescibacteria group bacterium]|nr:bifunctional DNA-formamidopyrimidine glycosylase/DNA-(apurinic or apyrimidinic site) lyase [Patescibacteria group bacterium]
MPELPEVETIVQGLNKKIKNRIIEDLWTDWPKYFQLPKSKIAFLNRVKNKKILNAERRGKNILFNLSNNYILLIHQKLSGHLMVGKWQYFPKGFKASKSNSKLNIAWRGAKWIPSNKNSSIAEPINRFIRLIFFLNDGNMIALSDLRRFAKVLCGPKKEILNLPEIKNLGSDPLDLKFTFKRFKEIFKPLANKKKGKIKQILMDQTFISGIGNIYADEILWEAKIHPLTKIRKLNIKDFQRIFTAIKKILKKAVQLRGTSIDDYRDVSGKKGNYSKELKVYQKENDFCRRCDAKIKRIAINNRSSHYCPRCQKLK